MTIKDKRKIRDLLRLCGALFFFWLYLPHLFVYLISISKRKTINSDLKQLAHQIKIGKRLPYWIELLYFIHNNRFYRCLFYHRIGPVLSLFIGWWRPGDNSFILPYGTKIGKNFWFAHPYSTVLNAKSIGDNFRCIHCTSIGTKNGMNGVEGGKPIIGDNVSVGCHVCIIGDIKIGNNVVIGAGSVVIKDVPDNAIIVGNPARIIKYTEFPQM
jgi:serine acetyltransferase